MKPGMGWPIGVIAILATTVVGNLVVMRIANSDPSFAVESDYYQKAVSFDSTMDLEQRSATLGWRATGALAADSGTTRVVIALLDAEQVPVSGATVSVDALFNARANDVLHVLLTEEQPGEYAAPLAVNHAGQWELRVRAHRVRAPGDTALFMSSLRVEAASPAVVRAGAPPSGALPSGALPSGALPSGALRTGALPNVP